MAVYRLVAYIATLSLSILLTACGGGDTPQTPHTTSTTVASATVVPTERRQALATTSGEASAAVEWTGCDITDPELLAYGGSAFPTLFPNYSGYTFYNNIAYNGVIYTEARYYPSTNNWLAVSEGGIVTGLGDYTGGQLATFGHKISHACSAKKLAYGDKRILYVGLKYKDIGDDPVSMDVVATAAEKVKAFYIENSYGKSVHTIDVKKVWLTLPETRQYYNAKYGSDERAGAFTFEMAKFVGETYPLIDVDLLVMVVSPTGYGWPGCSSGVTYVTSSGSVRPVGAIMLSGFDFDCLNAGVMAHELGHGYGLSLGSQLLHTSAILCQGWPRKVPAVLTDPTYSNVDCRQIQGDTSALFKAYTLWDTMGSYRGHFNSATKVQAGWLSTSQVAVLGTGGGATLAPYEAPSTKVQALTIPLGNDQTGKPAAYWAEYRRDPPMDFQTGNWIDFSWNKDLVKIWLKTWVSDVLGTGSTPSIEETSVFAFLDVQGNESSTELRVGDTFHDPYRGVRVKRGQNVGSDALVTVEVSKLIVTPRIGFELASLGKGVIKVENTTGGFVTTDAVVLAGRNPSWFRIESEDCGKRSLPPGASCTVTVSQVSRAQSDRGKKSAELRFGTSDELLKEVAVGLIGDPE